MSFKNIVVLAFVFFFDYSTCFLTRIYNKTLNNELIVNNLPIFNNGLVPGYFDWREHGAVSPIKNQSDCAASWAFGIAAHLESQYKLQYNREEFISEQFLIDCLNTSPGCQRGNVMLSLSEIFSTFGGVLVEKDYYPYASGQQSCRWDSDKKKLLPVTGSKRLYAGEAGIIDALLKQGPLIAGINSESMVVYKGGIDEPTDDKCDPNKLNHVVLIVGYNIYVSPDTKHIVPYWIIKNSWGDSWGDNGYYYLVRGRNACGVESEITHAYVN